MKKFLSMTLALIMALALCIPAFAATDPNTVEMNGQVKTPLISVDVPTGTAVIINPYELTVNMGSDSTPDNKTDSILNATHYITNYSESNISVGATVTATIPTGSGAKLLTAPATGTKVSTTKDVFLFFDIGVTADDDTTPAAWAAPDYGYNKSATTQIVPTAKGVNKTGLVILEKAKTPAVDNSGTPDNSSAAAGDNAGYAAFRMGGTANGAATETWGAGDVVNVTVAFTFTATSADYTGYVAP